MPHDGRKLLHCHLERSFAGKQDVTAPRGSENGSEQRGRSKAHGSKPFR